MFIDVQTRYPRVDKIMKIGCVLRHTCIDMTNRIVTEVYLVFLCFTLAKINPRPIFVPRQIDRQSKHHIVQRKICKYMIHVYIILVEMCELHCTSIIYKL